MHRSTLSALVLVCSVFFFSNLPVAGGSTPNNGTAMQAAGTLDVIVLDDFAKHRSDVHYKLHDRNSKKDFNLKFQDGTAPKDLRTGMNIRVKGKQSGTDILLKRSDVQIDSIPPLAAAATTAGAATPKSMAVILVNFQDSSVTCGTTTSCGAAMFGTTNSVNDLDRETSYGNVTVQGSTFGPYTIAAHAADACNFDQWGTMAETAAQNAGVDLSPYDYHQFIMPQSTPGQCSYAGIAYVGGNRSWIFNYCQCTDVMTHEFGHNLGMWHSSTLQEEYGDISDYMGYSCDGLRGVNGPHREEMKWLPTGNIQDITASGTYTLTPLENDPATATTPQLFRFYKADNRDHYYFSYRTATGYDTFLNNTGTPYAQGVNIHRWSGQGNTTFLQVLADGASFTDSTNGVTISQVSHSSSGAAFNVSIKPATASMSPSTLNFGTVPINSTAADLTTTLTNTGTTILSLVNVTITGTNQADFPLRSNSCNTNIPAGGSCTVKMGFVPSASGSRTATLRIDTNATTSPHLVNLSGSGGGSGPAVSLSPTSLSFGGQLLNTTSGSKQVKLSNIGNATLNISSIVASSQFAISSKTCGSTLAASASCTVNVTFRPTVSGTVNGSLTFTDSAGGSPHKVTLTGSGSRLKLSPTSLSYSTQVINTTSATKTVTLTNIGSSSLTINSIGISTHFVITSKTCGLSLAAGANCTVHVGFRPTSIGSKTGTLSIYNTGGATPRTVPLSGTGTQIKLSASSLTFAARPVGTTSGTQSVTLSNVGSTTVSISSISISGNFAVASKTCGSSLANGTSCSVTVKFHPTATGTRTGTLSIYNTGGGSPRTVKLTGTGT
jgi:hypothetical protein